MMKTLKPIAAALSLLLLSACSNEDLPSVANSNGITFSVEIPDNIGTRNFSEGSYATNLVYAVFDSQTGNLIYSPSTGEKPVVTTGDKKFNVTFNLVNGKEYDFIFWADQDKDIYSFSDDYRSLDIDYSKAALNKDDADAFYNVAKRIKVDGSASHTIVLRRPFAQINLGTDDLDKANSIDGSSVKEISMSVSYAYTHLDLFSGIASEPVQTPVKFSHRVTTDFQLPSFDFPVTKENMEEEPYKYLAMGYVLTGIQLSNNEEGSEGTDVQKAQQEIMNLNFEITLQNGDSDNLRENGKISVNVPNAPVQRNYRTNIYGSLLTSPNAFNIIIEPGFDEPDKDLLLIDDFQSLFSALNDGKDVVLQSDIDFPRYITVKKDVTIDLNGHTINVDHNFYGFNYGFQFMDANVTIKNGTINCSDQYQTSICLFIADNSNVTLENMQLVGPTDIYLYSDKSSVSIKSGKYKAIGMECVYSRIGGKAYIYGGEFESNPYNDVYYTLNLRDDVLTADIKASDIIRVMGGTFHNFNPAESRSENPAVSFVPDGYQVVDNGDGTFTVKIIE